MSFNFFFKNFLEFSKMDFCIRTRIKKFFIWKIIYSKSYIWIQRGKPHWTYLESKKPKRIKDTGLLRSRREIIELTSGAPCARCATSNRKKICFEIFFWKNVQNMIRNMTESLKYFFKISSHLWRWTKS